MNLQDALAKALAQPHEAAQPLRFMDFKELAKRPAIRPKPRWVGFPSGAVTVIAAHGGSAKSQITRQLAVAFASGKPLWGLPGPERCKVLALSGEDPEEEEHWRAERACRHVHVQMKDLDG